MNGIILYGTKYGSTKNTAEEFARKLGMKACNIMDFHQPIQEYEIIIIGTSVYVGRLPKQVKEFCKEYRKELYSKKVVMFTTGMQSTKEQTEKVILENLGIEFMEHLSHYVGFGGVLNFGKMNFMERKMIQLINKKSTMVSNLKNGECYDLRDVKIMNDFLDYVKRL